jgi:hypothetical protein
MPLTPKQGEAWSLVELARSYSPPMLRCRPVGCMRGLGGALETLIGPQHPMWVDANEHVDHPRALELDKAMRGMRRDDHDVPGPHLLPRAAADGLPHGAGTNHPAHDRVIRRERRGVATVPPVTRIPRPSTMWYTSAIASCTMASGGVAGQLRSSWRHSLRPVCPPPDAPRSPTHPARSFASQSGRTPPP